MIVDSPKTCAHKGCHCEVPAGQTYCSPHCANAVTVEASESDEARCACGHPQCGGEAANPASRQP